MSDLVETLSAQPARRELPTRAQPAPVVASARAEADEQKSETKRATIAALNRPTRARLAYDQIESRTFVEVLNPRTGEVLFRFPPESIRDHLADLSQAAPGGIVDKVA